MSYETRLIVLAVGTLQAVFAAAVLLICRKRQSVRIGLPVFILEDLFPAGGWLREKLPAPDRRAAERTRMLQEMNTPARAAQISANAAAAPYTYALLFCPFITFVYALSASAGVFVLETMLFIFLCMYFDLWLSSKVKKRHAEIREDYPAVLTEMALMVNVGNPAAAAFEKVAGSADGLLYREMQHTVGSMQNGMPAEAALTALTVRCPVREVRKFVSLYIQNLQKGGPDFPHILTEMAENSFEDRKNEAKAQGELAEQKLLIPTMFMFVGILLIVIVPAFRNIL